MNLSKRAILLWLFLIITVVHGKLENTFLIKEKDIMRKSIVFDKATPNVFYCPIEKPSSMNKLIVRSRPLHKLCEFEGHPLPIDQKPDCYQDMDESSYACKEKFRIMKRIAKG